MPWQQVLNTERGESETESDEQRANKKKRRSSRNVFTHQYRRTYEFPQNHSQSPRGNLVRFAATEQRWNVLEWDLCVSY